MFSDLVGSTALSACMDPEDLREVERAHWDLIVRQCWVMLIGCPGLAFLVLVILLTEMAPLPWGIGIDDREWTFFGKHHSRLFGDVLVLLLSLGLRFRSAFNALSDVVAALCDHPLEIVLRHLADEVDAVEQVPVDAAFGQGRGWIVGFFRKPTIGLRPPVMPPLSRGSSFFNSPSLRSARLRISKASASRFLFLHWRA